MKKTSLAIVALLIAVFLAMAWADPETFYSNPVYYGNAAFHTFISIEKEVPQTVGFQFSAAFFHDTPVPEMMLMNGVPMGMGSVELAVPSELSVYTPFQSIEIVNSALHPYPYNKTHLDTYFFFLNTEVRVNNITAGVAPKTCGSGGASPESYCRGKVALPAGCCPSSYINTGTIFAGVGGSIADALSPERLPPTDPNFGPWKGAFSFLIFNGRITGYKLMVPFDAWQEFMTGVFPRYCVDLRLPTIMPDPGYYPTSYCLYLSDTGFLRLEYSNFVHFDTNGCALPADPATSTCFVPPLKPGTPPPTADFIKYCTCS